MAFNEQQPSTGSTNLILLPRPTKTNHKSGWIFIYSKAKLDLNLTANCRITVNRKRSEISLQKSVLISEWDTSKNKGYGLPLKSEF